MGGDDERARLVVGLGNPGRRYERTRHNAGFRVVDRILAEEGAGSPERKFAAEVVVTRGSAGKVYWAKPMTFMNLSGPPVRDLLGYFRIGLDDLLVVHDDLDLPVGKVRLRRRGSGGGHKGVLSIIGSLSNEGFARVKIGIGRAPPLVDPADYVLMPPLPEEEEALEGAIAQAAGAVKVWLLHGLDRAMADYNKT